MKTLTWCMALVVAALLWSASAETKTVIFQQGLDGYDGCTDKELRDPAKNYGSGPKETELLLNGY
ncbi:MAG: hypothetical protein JXA18_15240 [Chitinispirillaceae bacterium]|nr:hypothetical protein [Chitinispirillaceae bacterium]